MVLLKHEEMDERTMCKSSGSGCQVIDLAVFAIGMVLVDRDGEER